MLPVPGRDLVGAVEAVVSAVGMARTVVGVAGADVSMARPAEVVDALVDVAGDGKDLIGAVDAVVEAGEAADGPRSGLEAADGPRSGLEAADGPGSGHGGRGLAEIGPQRQRSGPRRPDRSDACGFDLRWLGCTSG